MIEKETAVPHTLVLEDRSRLSLTGVKDILNFDNESVEIITVMGKAVIRGKDLRIDNFENQNGNLTVEGKFDAVVYLNESSGKHGFIGKLFK